MISVENATFTYPGAPSPILTAIIGAPFFIVLLRRTGGAR